VAREQSVCVTKDPEEPHLDPTEPA